MIKLVSAAYESVKFSVNIQNKWESHTLPHRTICRQQLQKEVNCLHNITQDYCCCCCSPQFWFINQFSTGTSQYNEILQMLTLLVGYNVMTMNALQSTTCEYVKEPGKCLPVSKCLKSLLQLVDALLRQSATHYWNLFSTVILLQSLSLR